MQIDIELIKALSADSKGILIRELKRKIAEYNALIESIQAGAAQPDLFSHSLNGSEPASGDKIKSKKIPHLKARKLFGKVRKHIAEKLEKKGEQPAQYLSASLYETFAIRDPREIKNFDKAIRIACEVAARQGVFNSRESNGLKYFSLKK